MMEKIEQFKHLLEYFVSHIEYVIHEDPNFIGYDEYIKPHIEANGEFIPRGTGWRRTSNFNQKTIAQWNDFGDDHIVSFKVGSGRRGADTKGTYLHWLGDAYSIKANWELDDDSYEWHVASLIICYSCEPPMKEASLDELGLFKKDVITDDLKQFWKCFESLAESGSEENDSKDVSIVDTLADLVHRNKNLILTGAPGTGKTYLAKQVARTIIDNDEYFDEQCNMVQFHPSYDYTDFIEGLRPVTQDNGQIGFKLEPGTFKQFCEQAAAYPDYPYVFIIDEINRGEVSKIFGELFFSLDPDYRGPKGRVKSQYHNLVSKNKDDVFAQGLYVPENVYVIATMNDIDRSVESIDFAFRRRFTWYEVKPEQRLSMLEPANLDVCQNNKNLQEKLDKASFYDCCKNYCSRLNEAICEEPGLGSAYQVGPAYLLKSLNYLNLNGDISEDSVYNALEQVWNLHIDPLLREYLRGKSEAELYKILLKLRNCYYYDNEDDYDEEY